MTRRQSARTSVAGAIAPLGAFAPERAGRLLRLEHTVARCLAESEHADAAIQAVIRAVAETFSWQCGRFFRCDDSTGTLRLAQAWSVPGHDMEQFVARSYELRYPRGIGIAGRVWQSGEPVWVADAGSDPRVAQAALALEAGMHGAFVFPVASEHDTIGVLSFSSREVRAPDEQVLQAVRVIGSQLGLFLQRRHAEESLRRREERYRSIIDNLAEAVVILDADGRVASANPSAERVLGLPAERLLGRSLADPAWQVVKEDGTPCPPEERPAGVTLRTGAAQSDIVIGHSRPDGVRVWLSVSTRALGGAAGAAEGAVVSFTDVTERRLYQERLTFLAQNDVLTGLPNRGLLLDRLGQALVRARRHGTLVGVLLIDLDRFKEINDSLGHSAGDTVLREVARRVRDALRDADTVARLGGDEFCIVLEDCDTRDKVSLAAAKVKRLFHEPVLSAENKEIFVEFSIGSSVYPDDGESIEELLRNADIAMYEAKHQGGDAFRFFSSALRAKSADEINMVAMLRRAIDRNELVLHYQPQVEIRSGRPVGAEALVRWEHPELGLVPPQRFIRAAEETGLIVPIGEWVLKTACAEAKAWQLAGMPELRVAVNLSARQFRDSQLVRNIAGVLGATALGPRLLELEITESVIMSNIDHTIGLLSRLVELGVRVAIDDFGTGYSSLAYLKRFPVSKLKIDRAFVRDIPGDADDSAIVQAVVTLGRSLDLQVCAEGVQSADQLAYLSSIGCDEYQGYLYSRPMTGAELVEFMRRRYVGMF